MRLAYQFAAFILLGLGALYAGLLNFLSPDEVLARYFGYSLDGMDAGLRLALETQIRLLAAMWVAGGAALFLCLKHFERHAAVFRLVTVGLALSGLGEVITAFSLAENPTTSLLKCGFQFLLCGGMEFWRMNMVARAGRVEA